MTPFQCPVCGENSESFNLDDDNIDFLNELKGKGILNEFISVCKINSDILRNTQSGAQLITQGVKAIRSTTAHEFSKLENELSIKIQRTLEEKIPNPEQLESLSRVIPEILLVVHDLLRKEEVSNLKGQEAEQELYDELSSYFPSDNIIRLGKSNETDIVITPVVNGISTHCEVSIESKKSKKWSRLYVDQLRRHMAQRKTQYGVLAVSTMPRGGNMYFTENHPEGTVFVTSIEQCKMAYGAIRAIIIADYSLGRRNTNFQSALKNAKIQTAIQNAFSVTTRLESIRKRTKTIVTNAKKIEDDSNEAEYILQSCLTELQTRIQDEIESPSYQETISPHMATSVIGGQLQDD